MGGPAIAVAVAVVVAAAFEASARSTSLGAQFPQNWKDDDDDDDDDAAVAAVSPERIEFEYAWKQHGQRGLLGMID